jgi:hypothetical protein
MQTEREAKIVYRSAIVRALDHLRESERLCARIDAVATRLHGCRWSWSTDPSAATRAG